MLQSLAKAAPRWLQKIDAHIEENQKSLIMRFNIPHHYPTQFDHDSQNKAYFLLVIVSIGFGENIDQKLLTIKNIVNTTVVWNLL